MMLHCDDWYRLVHPTTARNLVRIFPSPVQDVPEINPFCALALFVIDWSIEMNFVFITPDLFPILGYL
jgi:hypothetical protein